MLRELDQKCKLLLFVAGRADTKNMDFDLFQYYFSVVLKPKTAPERKYVKYIFNEKISPEVNYNTLNFKDLL